MTSNDDDTTQSVDTRWAYSNDLLAGLLLGALAASVLASQGLGWFAPEHVEYAFSAAALLAAIWAFGTESVNALRKLRGGD